MSRSVSGLGRVPLFSSTRFKRRHRGHEFRGCFGGIDLFVLVLGKRSRRNFLGLSLALRLHQRRGRFLRSCTCVLHLGRRCCDGRDFFRRYILRQAILGQLCRSHRSHIHGALRRLTGVSRCRPFLVRLLLRDNRTQIPIHGVINRRLVRIPCIFFLFLLCRKRYQVLPV